MNSHYCALFLSFFLVFTLEAKIKIACVGDSITFGASIKNRAENNYPKQLNGLLGDKYEIRNFGKNGATMLSKGNLPFINTNEYRESLQYQPSIVILKLGTNDSKPINWKFKDSFFKNALDIIQSYQELPSKPRIILCRPAPVFQNRWGINNPVTSGPISKILQTLAFRHKLEIIDLYSPLIESPEMFPDRVHPNKNGAKVIAEIIYKYLTSPRNSDFQIPPLKRNSIASFYGYDMISFKRNGVACTIVKPKVSAKNQPGIWRARFWAHEPQFEIAMLEQGWHVVYCDVANLYGVPKAVDRWNGFYEFLTSMNLSQFPVLMGMSRGGLIIHNWALANQNKVAGLIYDNAALDITSWPAGLGKGKTDERAWADCKKAYGFHSEEEAKNKYTNPATRTIVKLKQSQIPLLFLVGEKDKTVLPEENSLLAKQNLGYYPKAQFIIKKGLGHHPHSLKNPKPLITFALQSLSLKEKVK